MKRPGTVAVFALILAIFAVLLWPRVAHVERLKKRNADLDAELRTLREENARLEAELHLLRDDPVYLEKVAREKLNKAKQNEIVYRVVNESDREKDAG